MKYADISNIERRIVCAANRFVSNGATLMLVGPRHWDETMHTQYAILQDVYWQLLESRDFEQGFIDTWGNFRDRKTAWMIACYNDQIKKFVGSQSYQDFGTYGTKLHSENLY